MPDDQCKAAGDGDKLLNNVRLSHSPVHTFTCNVFKCVREREGGRERKRERETPLVPKSKAEIFCQLYDIFLTDVKRKHEGSA